MSTAALQIVIGAESLAALAREFGGERVYIPKRPERIKTAAVAQIRELRRQGLPIATIAKTRGCSERTVYRQLALRL